MRIKIPQKMHFIMPIAIQIIAIFAYVNISSAVDKENTEQVVSPTLLYEQWFDALEKYETNGGSINETFETSAHIVYNAAKDVLQQSSDIENPSVQMALYNMVSIDLQMKVEESKDPLRFKDLVSSKKIDLHKPIQNPDDADDTDSTGPVEISPYVCKIIPELNKKISSVPYDQFDLETSNRVSTVREEKKKDLKAVATFISENKIRLDTKCPGTGATLLVSLMNETKRYAHLESADDKAEFIKILKALADNKTIQSPLLNSTPSANTKNCKTCITVNIPDSGNVRASLPISELDMYIDVTYSTRGECSNDRRREVYLKNLKNFVNRARQAKKKVAPFIYNNIEGECRYDLTIKSGNVLPKLVKQAGSDKLPKQVVDEIQKKAK
jgi:hypothetical protein